jgi:hypothetical protein
MDVLHLFQLVVLMNILTLQELRVLLVKLDLFLMLKELDALPKHQHVQLATVLMHKVNVKEQLIQQLSQATT